MDQSPFTQLIHRLTRYPALIDEVELFRLDVQSLPEISFQAGYQQQHAALRVCSKGICGWSEGAVSHNDPSFELAPWGACFSELKGTSVSAALAQLQSLRETWWVNQLEMAEIALLDLAGQLLDEAVVNLLALDGRQPVPGMTNLPETSHHRTTNIIRLAQKQNLASYIKIQIYGELFQDTERISTVRQTAGRKSYLVADANEGYGRAASASIDILAEHLNALFEKGLNACQDPAALSPAEWVTLQKKVGLLELVASKPFHPAWQGLANVTDGMGRICLLHPGRLGSLADAMLLARRLQGFGARIAIGDNSFVGPGGTIWQQIAIGLEAAWVEALEKPEESDVFSQCVTSQSTTVKPDGRIGLVYDEARRNLRPGFGLEVDVPRLRKLCSAYCSI
ncbi:MAG: hypothetical protein P1S60_08330 [Anaerolineae bacterium]|nr:hypothetical protein [Anaerolineae bacterium]